MGYGLVLGTGGYRTGWGVGMRVGIREGWGGIGVGIRVDWAVYGCFGGMGRFGYGRFGGEGRKWGNVTKDFSRVWMDWLGLGLVGIEVKV